MKDDHTFSEILLTDKEFARLLNISVAEFISLDRSGMYAYIKKNGTIEEYFMYIHPDSPSAVLGKLKIEHHNFLRFSFSQVQDALVKEPEKEYTKNLIRL